MTIRSLGLALLAGLLLVLGMAAGACTDGAKALTLEEYFQKLDELDDEFNSAGDAIDGQIEGAQDLDEIKDLMDEQVTVFDDFIGGLEDLDPPDEVQQPHDDAIEGLSDFRDELSAAVDEAEDATTVDQAFEAFEDLDFTGIEQANAACLELEQIAADNSITVDLDCEEDAVDGGDGTDGDEPTPSDGDGDGEEPTPSGDGADGGDGSLEDYFQQLDALENEFRVASDVADAAISVLDATATGADAAAILEEVVAAIDTFIAGLQDLDPPEAAAEAHAETEAGFQVVADFLNDAIDGASEAQTIDEFFAFFDDPAVVSADESLDGACRALQSIANTNGISVDLGCPE